MWQRKIEYGNLNRPVLQQNERFEENAKHMEGSISLQYAVDSSKTPEEVAEEIPYDFPPDSIRRIREALDECDAVWLRNIDAMSHSTKIPISKGTQVDGMIYYTYTQDAVGSPLPLYIGMSRKMGRDEDSLNWNFANINRDSVFGR